MKDFKGKTTPITRKEFKGNWSVFLGLCKGCFLCLKKCPFRAILVDEKNLGVYSTPAVKVDREKCTLCSICEQVCPDCAIKIEKKA